MVMLGTSVILYGTITAPGHAVSSYSVDNGTAFTYIAPSTTIDLYQWPFYGASGLKAGQHNLTVTVENADLTGYWLDYASVS